MKYGRLAFLLLFILTACTNGSNTPATSTQQELPTPVINVTSAPDSTRTAQDFLDRWKASDYAGMYALLSPTSRDAVTEDDFIKLYTETAENLTLKGMDFSILSSLTNPQSAKVGYAVAFHTNLVGDLERQMEMNLQMADGSWKVAWDDGMILPEMKGGSRLMMQITQPARGDIYDNTGNAIATETDAVALGVMPGQVSEGDFENLVVQLSGMTGQTRQSIQDQINNSADWYVPIGEVSKETFDKHAPYIANIAGLVTNEYTDRYYYNGGIAPQTIGYLLSIAPEEMSDYLKAGYPKDAKVGKAGLEKTEESVLAGTPGADLYVIAPDGSVTTRLAHTDPVAAHNITTTLDKNLQLLSQKAIMGFTGAIVVLERDTGRVLAMVSSPSYDPNLFLTTNYNSQFGFSEQGSPLLNRAAQSSYPLGSVFKLVTMSAALESGNFTTESTYECTSQYTELPGFVGNDWTFDKDLPPSGNLTLLGGLMRSCNPWFYHLGLELYRYKGDTYLADMARGFGLGSPTGITGVYEDAGQINNPTDEGAAVQMGIGQGDMLVTPLQVADFIAAIGNGGTLYTPQLIEKITDIDGNVLQSFTPAVRGKLPVSQKTLDALKEGMQMVVREQKGTAYRTFVGVNTPIYGKTGTATTSLAEPHAWFAGFTDAGNANKPDIAIVVIAENSGDGSVYAAPIFRRVIEAYFTGEAYRLYPWESQLYVTKTPTEEFTPTPAQ